MTEGPRVNFTICEALFDLHVDLLSFIGQNSRIQSLCLYFIQKIEIKLPLFGLSNVHFDTRQGDIRNKSFFFNQ